MGQKTCTDIDEFLHLVSTIQFFVKKLEDRAFVEESKIMLQKPFFGLVFEKSNAITG